MKLLLYKTTLSAAISVFAIILCSANNIHQTKYSFAPPFLSAGFFSFAPDSLYTTTLAIDLAKSEEDKLQAVDIIRARLAKIDDGGAQLNFDANTGHIIITTTRSLDKPTINYLTGEGRLEFYECYSLASIFPYLKDADKAYAKILSKQPNPENHDNAASFDDLGKSGTKDADSSNQNNTTYHFVKPKKNVTDLNNQNSKEDKTSKNNDNTPLLALLLTYMGKINSDMIDRPVIGIVNIKDTSKITKILNLPEIRDALPPDLILAWEVIPILDVNKKPSDYINLIALKSTGLPGHEAAMFGNVITAASAVDDHYSHHVVDITMNPNGAMQWEELTRRNIQKSIAVVFDNRVYSYPKVMDEIRGGRAQISGNFSKMDAKYLAATLMSGVLPLKVSVVTENFAMEHGNAFFGKRALVVYAVILFLLIAGGVVYISLKKPVKPVA